ncbi:MAG TPA: hypothetical protein VKY24_16325 [Reyranella sp.]|nr:hypothetical protein [Reyranella sp.]
MPRISLFAVAAAGLSVAACSYSSTTSIPASPGPVLATSPSAEACLDYGFVPGTIAYNRCVERTHAARVAGRVSRGYAEAQLVADARNACISYGLEPVGGYFDRCVAREMDARRYRADQAYVPADVYPQPAYVPPAPPAGVQAFRDEYGFRYDGQGNRLDAHGNIISPHSTQP